MSERETTTGGGAVEMYKTIPREEYERLRRIADAVFGCLGCMDAGGTLKTVRDRLERAVKRGEAGNG